MTFKNEVLTIKGFSDSPATLKYPSPSISTILSPIPKLLPYFRLLPALRVTSVPSTR